MSNSLIDLARSGLNDLVEFHLKVAEEIAGSMTNGASEKHINYLVSLMIGIGFDKLCSIGLIFLRLSGWRPSNDNSPKGKKWAKLFGNAEGRTREKHGTLNCSDSLNNKLFFLDQIKDFKEGVSPHRSWIEVRNWTTHDAFFALGYKLDRDPDDKFWIASITNPELIFSPPVIDIPNFHEQRLCLLDAKELILSELERQPRLAAASEIVMECISSAQARIPEQEWPPKFLPQRLGEEAEGHSSLGPEALAHFNEGLFGVNLGTLLKKIDELP